MVEVKVRKLNLQQEKFCKLYATNEEFFGSGIWSYVEVYKPKKVGNWYKSAQASASRLLSSVIVCERINELLEKEGLNNEFVDKQTLFLITQHSDFNSKIRAIQEYNKLKKRITEKEGDKNLTINLINYGGDNHSLPIRAKNISVALPEKPKEIQGADNAQEKWEIKDSIKSANTEGSN